MATLSEALALAIQHHQAGRLPAAEQIYRQILLVEPYHADALHMLGVIAAQVGKPEIAVDLFRRAIRVNGSSAPFHTDLGNALKEQGKLDQAVACYRYAIKLKPDYAEAHNNLGNALKDQEKPDEAIASYRKAMKLNADYVDPHYNLGVVFQDQGKLDDAIACYRRALQRKPDHAVAHNNLGSIFRKLGRFEEAIASYRRAVELQPNYAVAHYNLGGTLRDQGKLDEAAACCRRAIELKPDFAEAHNVLGNVLRDQGKLDEAADCCRRAVELNPDLAEAHNILGNVLRDQGKLDESIACYRRALELDPDSVVAHNNLVFTLQYCTGVTPSSLAEAHAEFDRRHAAPLRGLIVPFENLAERRGRLRLGFVSPDLKRHPVGYFLIGVLENLSRETCETVCYSDRVAKDDLTRRFQAAASQWRDVFGISDQRLAEQIRADRIDILFDLAGHTSHNRLLVFARRPAPVQITWAGYVGTTGLSAMDYLLADRYEVPPGAEHHYREQVLRMPDGYVCYEPPDYAPPVTRLPALDGNAVTFACFNNPAKITPQAIEVWAKILHRLPQSRLVLKFKGWNLNSVAGRFTELFAAQAIDPARLELLGPSPHDQYLAEYQRIDLALDPFPYSGGLTTCEALWMGVPVVTCPGETFAGRHSLSHLSNVGLTETIARDLDEYVELAVSLAGDLPRLAELRAGLRERMAASPLCDGKRFANNLASLLHGVWQRRS